MAAVDDLLVFRVAISVGAGWVINFVLCYK